MSESLNNRIKFDKKGTARNFILQARELLKLTKLEFANKLGINRRTLADWTREEITISQIAVKKISKWTSLPIPKNHTIIDGRARLQNAGRIGGRNKFKIYGSVSGNEEYRKEKWKQWWDNVGKYQKPAKNFQTIKKIRIPRKSKLLAEFIGILLGDGNLSPYHIGITLSSEEKQYIVYVEDIIVKLFGVVPKIFRHKKVKAVTIVVNRKLLVDFCQKMGFEIGNKVAHQVDIPQWIKENKEFSRECVRGLFDTDGCFFTHSYIMNKKKYSYLKIAFTNASLPLVNSVAKTLINFGIHARMSKVRINNNGRDVRIDDVRFVAKYIIDIGSHNQKHLDKIEKWKVALNGKAAVC